MLKNMKSVAVILVTMMFLTTAIGCSSSKSNTAASNTPATTPAASGAVATPATPAPTASNTYPENGLPKDQKVTLKLGFFVNASGSKDIESIMKTFTDKYPNVTFDSTFSPDIFKLIETKIGAGDDKDMFDMFASSDGFANLAALVDAGKIESQEDLWDREALDTPGKKVKDVLLDGLYKGGAFRVKGKSYFIADSGWTGGLYYDKALFEKNGWNQDPKTYDEFVALLEKIKTAGVIPLTYAGVYPGYLDFGFGGKDFEIAEENGNLDAFFKNYKTFGVPWYTAPETKEKWNRIYELGKKGYFPDGVAAINHVQSQMQVLQHKAAMVFSGSWIQQEMKDSTPAGFVWGYMAIPPKKAGQATWVRNGVQGGFFIWAAKPDLNKKWAKEFALWLLTLDAQKKGAASGSIPVRKDFGDDPARLALLSDAPKAVTAYIATHKVHFENQVRDFILTDPTWAQSDKTLQDATPAISTGKKDPGPVLEAAEKLFEKAKSKQK